MDTVAKYEATQFLNTLRAADQNVSDLDSTSSSNSLRTKFLKRLPSDYHPQFAYVVVKKRISTRILLKKGANYENPPPGTVLDHTVTNFNFKDFFLVPQGMRKGFVSRRKPSATSSSYFLLLLSCSCNDIHICLFFAIFFFIS